jgi:probable HAF family extracellular repeat protein
MDQVLSWHFFCYPDRMAVKFIKKNEKRMKNMRYLQIIGVIIAITILGNLPEPSAAANQYFFRDLGTLGGRYSAALDINDLGQVVGLSGIRIQGENEFSENIHAFLWDNLTGMQDLGPGPGENFSIANNVDNFGRVFGISMGLDDAEVSSNMNVQAFQWHNSRGRRGVDDREGWFNKAYRANVRGQMIGFELNSNGDSRAILWNRARIGRDLGTLPGHDQSMAFGINNLGQVVGCSRPGRNSGFGRCRAFRWDERQGMKQIGPLNVHYSVAKDINDAGQILGQAVTIENGFQAYLWDPNNGTQFLSEMAALDPGWTIRGVSAINNLGQITGDATFDVDGDGVFDEIHAFLLTPINIVDIQKLIAMSSNLLPEKEGTKLVSDLYEAIKKLNEGKTEKTFEILTKFIKEVGKLNAKYNLSDQDHQTLVDGAYQVQASLIDSAVFFKIKDLIIDLIALFPDKENEKLVKILQQALEELAKGKPDKTRDKLEKFKEKVDQLIDKGDLANRYGQELKAYADDTIDAI